MSIERKVKAVNKLFDRLSGEIAVFQSKSGLHCKAGCGSCCTKPDIDASPLEFLPWAFHTFLQGKAEETLDRIATESSKICYLYQPLSILDVGSGSCVEYQHRGLICRLFGFGAGRDKIGKLRLATCKIIKEKQKEEYEQTVQSINAGVYVPIFSDYYAHLSQIDFRLGNTIVPINMAMRQALEEVLKYYAYRPFPRGMKKSA